MQLNTCWIILNRTQAVNKFNYISHERYSPIDSYTWGVVIVAAHVYYSLVLCHLLFLRGVLANTFPGLLDKKNYPFSLSCQKIMANWFVIHLMNQSTITSLWESVCICIFKERCYTSISVTQCQYHYAFWHGWNLSRISALTPWNIFLPRELNPEFFFRE